MILQIGYAGVLAFMLLAHRNDHRRQILRIPAPWATRVRLARMMRDINDRVGHYLFSLAVIYACVAVVAAGALALLGFPNAIMWGIVMGLASFVPFVGAPLTIGLVALVALISFDDWLRIVGAPAALLVIHFAEIAVHHAGLREPPLCAQYRGGVRHHRAAGLDVGRHRRHRGGAAADPAQHHCCAPAVIALAGSDAVG